MDAEPRGMARGVPVALVVAAAAADGAGMHGVAFYALLAAVPAVAAAALGAYGDALERARGRLHAYLWGIVLALTVAGGSHLVMLWPTPTRLASGALRIATVAPRS